MIMFHVNLPGCIPFAFREEALTDKQLWSASAKFPKSRRAEDHQSTSMGFGVSWRKAGGVCLNVTLRETNIAMKNPPLEDGYPIKNGGFSIAVLVYRRVV